MRAFAHLGRTGARSCDVCPDLRDRPQRVCPRFARWSPWSCWSRGSAGSRGAPTRRHAPQELLSAEARRTRSSTRRRSSPPQRHEKQKRERGALHPMQGRAERRSNA